MPKLRKNTYAMRYVAGQPAERILPPRAFAGVSPVYPAGTPLSSDEKIRVLVWNIFKQQRAEWQSVLKISAKMRIWSCCRRRNHPRTGPVRDFKLSGRRSGAGAGIAAASFRRNDAGLRAPHLLLSAARARAYFAIAEIGVSDRLSAAECAVVDGSQYPCRQL